ncbi:MAG: hypothetical protein JO139_11895 [Alphaproteobacteria bacterium]|nr:hypothetical protein [Alphaproteobacteria bacterium]
MLPQPGAWIDVFKQFLAFPFYATVAWLVWVLIQEVGPGQSLAPLFGLVLVGFAAWVYGGRASPPRSADGSAPGLPQVRHRGAGGGGGAAAGG